MDDDYYDICMIPYAGKTGERELPVKLYKENIWLSQKDMALLFEKSYKTISEHIKNVYKNKELSEKDTSMFFHHKSTDGKMYKVQHYTIEVVVSLAYRVHSHQAHLFRIWATSIVAKHIIKEFSKNA